MNGAKQMCKIMDSTNHKQTLFDLYKLGTLFGYEPENSHFFRAMESGYRVPGVIPIGPVDSQELTPEDADRLRCSVNRAVRLLKGLLELPSDTARSLLADQYPGNVVRQWCSVECIDQIDELLQCVRGGLIIYQQEPGS